jgi:hypothetical protein
MFKKGDHVALNAEWMKHSGGGVSGRMINDRATILGPSRSAASCFRLVFDGRKTPRTFHQSFLRKIRK